MAPRPTTPSILTMPCASPSLSKRSIAGSPWAELCPRGGASPTPPNPSPLEYDHEALDLPDLRRRCLGARAPAPRRRTKLLLALLGPFGPAREPDVPRS